MNEKNVPPAAAAVRINVDISDEDIYDAMAHVSGYVDITTEDFHQIYLLAHEHALQRLVGRLRAADVMSRSLVAVTPDTLLDQTARLMAEQGLKSIPVVDAQRRVVGIMSETDYLERLGAKTFMEFLIKYLAESQTVSHRCHETRVEQAMTTPVTTVAEDADFVAIMRAFKEHGGRRMPVVDAQGRLAGMLARKDFIHAAHLETVA